MPKGRPNNRYTPEFKKMVIETMRTDRLSYVETAQKFDIPGHESIRQWERIYLEEGPKGFSIERRGRKSTGRPRKLSAEVETDLIAENQRLRMENAYLKKLQALVLEDERRRHKKPR